MAIYRASLLLSMAGLEKDGLALAKTLAESGKRNKALLKIARGNSTSDRCAWIWPR
jgi:hypothetical protein